MLSTGAIQQKWKLNMKEVYEENFKEILRASQQNNLTFFVGAGVSCLSHAPNWSDAIKEIRQKLGEVLPGGADLIKAFCQEKTKLTEDSIKKFCQKYETELAEKSINDFCQRHKIKSPWNLDFLDFLEIPQKYYFKLKKDVVSTKTDINEKTDTEYYDFLRKLLGDKDDKKLKPTTIHKRIFELNPASIITTNFDHLLETAAVDNQKFYKSIALDEDVSSIAGDRFILKIHGDLEHQNIVFKEEDYLNYSKNFKMIETLTKAIFATNTIVFIGCSLNDYNVRRIIHWIKEALGEKFRSPIFIHVGHEKLDDKTIEYQKNIRSLSVIDCNDLAEETENDEYLERYEAFFNALCRCRMLNSSCIISRKIIQEFKLTDKELFDSLYNRLKPLHQSNQFSKLKTSDVQNAINASDIMIGTNGFISRSSDDAHPLFKHFLELHRNTNTTQTPEENDKYETIKRVFERASIKILDKDSPASFHDSYNLNKDICICYDFEDMEKACENNKLQEAFYLTRLFKFNDALDKFKLIAQDSFNTKDYFNYYIANLNVIFLSNISNGSPVLEKLNREISSFFSSLPQSFQTENNFLKTYETASLYNFFYKARKLSDWFVKIVDNNSIVTGWQSPDVLLYEEIKFIVNNYLTIDIFPEFKDSVVYLMKAILYNYSKHTNKSFENFHIYCMIESFSQDNLIDVIKQYGIERIKCADSVQEQLLRIFRFYAKNTLDTNVYIGLQGTRIANALILMAHMTLNKETFKEVNNLLKNMCEKFRIESEKFRIEKYFQYFLSKQDTPNNNEHKAEVKGMILTEYNEEEVMNGFKEEAYMDGVVKTLIDLVKEQLLSISDAAKKLNVSEIEFKRLMEQQ